MRRLAFTALALIALGVASRAGAQTAISLSIPPNARANGMGEAYVAIADDATATWWNPGGLGFLDKKEASISYAKLVPQLANDVFVMFPAAVRPNTLGGSLGVSLIYLSYGTSEATSTEGQTLRTFTSYELAPVLSYGTKVTNLVGVGVSAKYVRVSLAPADVITGGGSGTGSTVAFDAGILVKVPGNMVNLGLAVQNIGPDMRFISADQADPIYRNAKAGFAVNAYDNKEFKVTVIGDVNQLLVRGEVENNGVIRKVYQRPIYNGGAELAYQGEVAVALRGGYVRDPDGSINDPTYGLGIGYRNLDFDFASTPQAKDPDGNRLGRVSRFSLGVRF